MNEMKNMKVGDEVETSAEKYNRLTSRSDGKFASAELWVKVDDHISTTVPQNTSDEEGIRQMFSENERVNGDRLFDSMTLADYELVKSKKQAENSCRGYNSRYLLTKCTKSENQIRYRQTYNGTKAFETGSFVPVRVKVVALPNDRTADECSTYDEYVIKNRLLGNKDFMSEREFTVYKY